VLRALAEASGTTRCTTAKVPELDGAKEGDETTGGFDAGAGGDGSAAVPLAGADSFTVGFELLTLGGAAVVFAEAAGVAAEGEALFEPDLTATGGEDEVSAELRSIRGTIRAARTSVPAAPIRKYFSEPPEARALCTRRGAAIVTFTFGSDETGICDGAFARSMFGAIGESGTESGSTDESETACAARDLAAPAADACAAAARGVCAGMLSVFGATGVVTASTRASGVRAATAAAMTGFGLGT